MPRPPHRPARHTSARGDAVSLARALSKLGVCSRREAERWIGEGRVAVDGRVVRDPTWRVDPARDRLSVDGGLVRPAERVYLALHKPRGVVTSRVPERGAPTVYDHLDPALSHVAPVGRLDKASEGLLLLTNDTRWAARLTDPASHVDKRYHVQVDRVADDALLAALRAGARTDEGETLRVKDAALLRAGTRTSWLELVLDEGRNRHIRRLLAALGVEVLRLVRVAIGPLPLGSLPRGAVRTLTAAERDLLARAADAARSSAGDAG